jgi:hypothetical protein
VIVDFDATRRVLHGRRWHPAAAVPIPKPHQREGHRPKIYALLRQPVLEAVGPLVVRN